MHEFRPKARRLSRKSRWARRRNRPACGKKRSEQSCNQCNETRFVQSLSTHVKEHNQRLDATRAAARYEMLVVRHEPGSISRPSEHVYEDAYHIQVEGLRIPKFSLDCPHVVVNPRLNRVAAVRGHIIGAAHLSPRVPVCVYRLQQHPRLDVARCQSAVARPVLIAARKMAQRPTRRASHAGSWYTSDPRELSSQLTSWLAETQLSAPAARAVIAPHAGYSFSGPTAAWAYRHVQCDGVRRVFLLGPSHNHYTTKCLISTCTAYAAPNGHLAIDDQVYNDLAATGQFDEMQLHVDEREHSLEMHLPYIAHIMGTRPYTLVPILVGALSEQARATRGSGPFSPDLTIITWPVR